MGSTLDGMGRGLPIVTVSLSSLRRNWRFLNAGAGSVPPLAVIKADAYGHGILTVATTLMEEGCRMVAAGSVSEGASLRASLGKDGAELAILPLLGVVAEEDAAICLEYNLIPLVQSARAISWLKTAHTGKTPLPIAVKVETGMSRLGFRHDGLRGIVEMLKSSPNLLPAYLLSHLASADDPEQEESVLEQAFWFMEAFTVFYDVWPAIIPSLANSAGLLARERLLKGVPAHLSRPGYALYGGNPFAGTAWERLGEKLLPVMSVSAPILGVHTLAKGGTVSYGRTFTAPEEMKIAIVGAGYADGFSRSLSGRGRVSINGVQCPVLGRVCMQMHIADVSHVPGVACGDTAHILGGAVSMADVAADWGTIPYEVFCLLGKNTRKYV